MYLISDTIPHYDPLKPHCIHGACDLYVSAPGKPANGSIRFPLSSELLNPPGSSDIDSFPCCIKSAVCPEHFFITSTSCYWFIHLIPIGSIMHLILSVKHG